MHDIDCVVQDVTALWQPVLSVNAGIVPQKLPAELTHVGSVPLALGVELS